MKQIENTRQYQTKNVAIVLIFCGLLSFLVTTTTAATLVTYDMEASGIPRDNPSTVDPDVSATNLSLNNLNPSGTATPTSSSDTFITIVSQFAGGTTVADALTAGTGGTGTYFDLTITPDALRSITLNSISFDIFAATAGPSARQLYLFSDKTGFTDGDQILSAGTTTGSPLIPYNTTTTGENFNIDLSGNSAFANITDSVTFRFYTQTPTAFQALAFDDITVDGTVAVVPEPSSFALLVLAGIGFFFLRSRSK